MDIADTARGLTLKYGGGCARWKVGDTVRHPHGYDVTLTSGCYLDPTYGRLSNFWHWVRVDTGAPGHGYGWG